MRREGHLQLCSRSGATNATSSDFREGIHIAGNREDFVKIVRAQVRLPRIIHGEECLLQPALYIEAGGPV
jgi:hypothetical protein